MTQTTYDMLEERVQMDLKNLPIMEEKERKELAGEITQFVELLIAADKEDSEEHDKKERRRIEEERNRATFVTESAKQEITWQKVGLEMAKLIVPLFITMSGYNLFQKRIIKFEETGRFTTTAARELHLPNIFKK